MADPSKFNETILLDLLKAEKPIASVLPIGSGGDLVVLFGDLAVVSAAEKNSEAYGALAVVSYKGSAEFSRCCGLSSTGFVGATN